MASIPDFQPAQNRRPPGQFLYAIVYVGALLVAGFFLGQPLLLLASLLVLGVSILPELWRHVALSGITVRRTLRSHRVLLGEEVLLTLRVENRKLLPVPRLDIEDDVPQDGLELCGAALEISGRATRALLVNTFSLWTLQRITRRYHIRCLTRGVYTFGSLRLVGGDPFGMLTSEQIVAADEELLVYPLTVPLERLGLTPHDLYGTQHVVHLLEDPLHTVGVRDYLPGDDPRRIHWKATARRGHLQSRVYEPSARRTLALFLDVRTSNQPALTGYDPALVELMICATASLAFWAAQQGDAVGLYANGTLVGDNASALAAHHLSHLRIKPSAGAQQLIHVQETLARFIPFFTANLADILLHDATHLPAGASIVVVGTSHSLDANTKAVLRQLQAGGHPISVLLAGNVSGEANEHKRDSGTGEVGATQSQDMLADLPIVLLGDASTWHAVLSEALEAQGGGIISGFHHQGSAASEDKQLGGNSREARMIPHVWGQGVCP